MSASSVSRHGNTTDGRLRLPPQLSPSLIEPGDHEYPRVSGTYTRRAHPAVVLFPESSDEVALVLAAVRHRSLPVAVRSGGHGLSGRSTNDGGLVIDLSRLSEVEVIAPSRHLVRVGAGARWGTVTDRLPADGLSIKAMPIDRVGIAGLSYVVRTEGQALAAWADAVSRSPRELSVMATLVMYGTELVLDVTAVIASSREEVIRAALGRLLEIGPVRADANAFARAYPGRTGERVRAAWRRLDPDGRIRPME